MAGPYARGSQRSSPLPWFPSRHRPSALGLPKQMRPRTRRPLAQLRHLSVAIARGVHKHGARRTGMPLRRVASAGLCTPNVVMARGSLDAVSVLVGRRRPRTPCPLSVFVLVRVSRRHLSSRRPRSSAPAIDSRGPLSIEPHCGGEKLASGSFGTSTVQTKLTRKPNAARPLARATRGPSAHTSPQPVIGAPAGGGPRWAKCS